MNLKKNLLPLFLCCCFLMSCHPIKEVAYLQDAQINTPEKLLQQEVKITNDDMLSIMINSSNPELVIPFNMPLVSYQMTQTGISAGGAQRVLGYIVDSNGEIDFPVLGKLKVSGLSRRELAEIIKNKLTSEGLVKDAVVTVQFQNFKISVLGEVNRPGTFNINSDRVTVLEALGMAGDLTVYGRRDKVIVVRELNGERTVFVNDIRNSDIFNSPSYYLQQNDVVYVEPNKIKAGQRNINANTSISTWVSIASLFTTIAVIIFK